MFGFAMLALQTSMNPVLAKTGLVVSDHRLCSEIGRQILREGGNAVDAAVATGFALAVTSPAAGNIGGGGFMLVRLNSGESVFIDYRETAPKAATPNMYLDKAGKPVPDLSTDGYLAAGVPGTVMGFWQAHQKYGKLPWKQLLAPAIRLATQGFEVSPYFADELKSQSKLLSKFSESKRVYLKGGSYWAWGEKFVNLDLAKTLSRVQNSGADGFYKGETAKQIAADMKANGGIITEQDLANYRAVFRVPLKSIWRGLEVLSSPPPSSGGVTLFQMLGMTEKDDFRALGHNSAASLHLMVEAMKRAFADRNNLLGDPDFVKLPLEKLLNPAYWQSRRAEIRAGRATPSNEILPLGGDASVGKPEGENTMHFSVVDAEGNAVANTYTLNTGYGSGAVVRGAGFLLNNEMDDFSAGAGVANRYGLLQGQANAIAPGKRPLSSMTPTILVRKGRPVLIVGSPGGPTIINTVFQTILNWGVHGMNVQQAVSAPRVHHQWQPDSIRNETFGMSADVRALLTQWGHSVERARSPMGSCHAIAWDERRGCWAGGIDPRLPESGAAGY